MRRKSFGRLKAFSIEAFAEAERLVAIAAVWNNRFSPAPMQFSAQLGAVVSLIADRVFRRLHSAEKGCEVHHD
jgi:hypothetical protein